ncbi:hypothetical protein [Amycolatopsis sp.]|uniref:hypothetical protein n=1 Tax=Amycolatopsis sp. TaxID=37632 RepID=UPI002D0AAF4B|nr:hypothetical protein [Amycolatopsis sp.]HVV11713.1 hypothetical protein [Amycolatopsis sp.]
MNDEVSVAELLEREGWRQAGPAKKRRLPMLAVMLAVIVGCGLAAVLVHFGSRDPQADSPALLNVPHLPTGGLAGGGIPWETPSEVTGTESSVVVTNEAPPDRSTDSSTTSRSSSHHTQTQTITVTGEPSEGDSTAPTTNSSNPGNSSADSTTSTPGDTSTPPSCRLFILCW